MDAPDLLRLPEGLPVPVDDGAASHLPGRAMPALSLPATDGRQVAGRAVVDRNRQALRQPQQVGCVHGFLPRASRR